MKNVEFSLRGIMHYQKGGKKKKADTDRLERNCGQFCNQEKAGFLLKAFDLFGKEKPELCQISMWEQASSYLTNGLMELQ